jgi:GNAT superfamily N-acetyltransferase
VDLLDFFEASVAQPTASILDAQTKERLHGKGAKKKNARPKGPLGGQQADPVQQDPEVQDRRPVQAEDVDHHPRVTKDMEALDNKTRQKTQNMLTLLASGHRHTSTHPLTGLKGWESTHVDKRTLIVHQQRDEGLYVGYIGGQHNYGAAHRRLGSLDLLSHFGSANVQYRVEYPRDHEGEGHAVASIGGEDVGRLRWDYHADTPTVIDMSVDEEHRRKGIGTGLFNKAKEHESGLQHSDVLTDDGRAFKNASKSEHYFSDEYQGNPHISFGEIGEDLGIEPHHVNSPAHDSMKKSPYNERVTIPRSERVNISQPTVTRKGVQKYLDQPDHEPIHVAHDPEFDDYTVLEGHHRLVADRLRGRSTEAYVAKPMSRYAILVESLKGPGWLEDHAWLPNDRIFGAGKGGLDPRLFDTESRIMHPAVKKTVIDAIDGLWAKYDPNWQRWARVYLAGSEASEWWGNNDFDCLIGIDHDRARARVVDWAGMTDDSIDSMLTQELRENLNNEDYVAPWDGEIWHQTFFVNPNSYDIRKIKPYAAYDITRDLWAVDPVKADKDWGATKLPEALFSEGEGLVKQIDAIERLPDTQRTGRGAALWDYLHNDRRRAFSDEGEGVFDTGNAVWKYLDMHPTEPLTRLLRMKREALQKKRVEEAV